MRRKLGFCIVAALFAVGCHATMTQHSFPTVWPAGLTVPPPSTQREIKGDVVWVEPIVWDGASSATTPLTDALIRYLRAGGVDARSKEATGAVEGTVLSCTVRRLDYQIRSGYPKKVVYNAAFLFRVVDLRLEKPIIDREMSHEFEHHILLNTMTRLPQDPYSHEQMLLRHAAGPVWEALAASLRALSDTLS